MENSDSVQSFLAGLFDINNSDSNSDHNSNGSVRSGYLDGGSIVGELSVYRVDQYTTH